MQLTYKELSEVLSSRSIRPSFQRIKVLEYLHKKQGHPSVEQVYKALQVEIPSLSKTTIYNSLNRFLNAGLVRVLNIEENETCYDIITGDHGHFKCEKCGTIYNFSMDINALNPKGLNSFKIYDRNVYFKGVCSKCLININTD